MTTRKNIISNILVAAAVIAVFIFILLYQSGMFDKAPTVEAVSKTGFPETLHVITDEDYSPYSFYDSNGAFSGYDVELITIIANKLEMNLDLRFMSWIEGIEAITAGDADVLMTCDYSDSFNGVDRLVKSEPTSSDDFIVYSNRRVSSVSEMYGRRVAIMENGNVTPQMEMLGLSRYCVKYKDNRTAMQALVDGEVDYAVMRQAVGAQLLEELNAKRTRAYFSAGRSYMCFGINNDNPAIADKINRAIEDLNVSGETDRLRNKWLTTFVRPYTISEVISRNIWIVFLFALFVLAFLILANRRKKRELRDREKHKREVLEQKYLVEKTQALANQFIESFTNAYNVAFKVGLADDSLSVLRMDGELLSTDLKFDKFSQVAQYFIYNSVFEPDRDLMRREMDYAHIRGRLASDKSYSVEFRTVKKDVPVWTEMTVTSLEGGMAAIGFAVRNQEIILRHLQEKSNEDYYALFSIDLDADIIAVIKPTVWYKTGAAGECARFSEVIKDFASKLESEPGEFFMRRSDIGQIREEFATEDKHTYSYKSNMIEGGRWVTVISFVVARHEDGTPAVITLGFCLMDSLGSDKAKLMDEIAEKSAFTSFFLEPYISAYYVGLEDMSCQNYRKSPRLKEQYLNIANYLDSLNEYIGHDVHHDDREKFYELVQPARMKELLAARPEFSYVYRALSEDGLRYFRFQVIRGADERHAAFGFRDITDQIMEQNAQRKQLEDALAMSQSASRAKTTFLNNMSHDIRTPMNAIIGYTGLAESHIDNKALVRDYLNKIGQSSNHLLSLINDVLDMSRIESGKVNLDEKEENLSEIIHTLRNIIQANVRVKHLDFDIDAIDINDENIICDKLRLNQVLLNVLSNAIKYTPAGGRVSLKVSEKNVSPNGYAEYEFRVKDNGIGMESGFLKTIFDPFTRVNSSTVSGIQGTGLGMAITKSLVDMAGGKIEVESEPGKGTEVIMTFHFKLQSDNDVKLDLPSLKGCRALVVDDDADTCMSVTKMLRDAGMRSLWCTSGKEALLRVQDACKSSDLYQLYIIDLLMPDMNGIETTMRMRKIVGDEAPVIIMTSCDWSDFEAEGREAGVSSFVSKPLFPSDLMRLLQKCLGDAEKGGVQDSKSVDLSGRKILLVEDNVLNCEIAKAILEECGCEIETAEDGEIAVEKMKSASAGDFDLVLMDIQMPVLNGYEATRQIRALGTEISRIPILAMTANAFEEDRVAALEAGMNEHIAKPIDIDALKSTLAKFL